MKLSLWRSQYLAWLQSQLTVDSWELDTPEDVGQTAGFLPPIRDLEYRLASPVEIETEATQDFYLVKSYDGMLAFQDLAIGTLEGLYQTLAIRLVHDYKTISPDLTDLLWVPQAQPVTVRQAGDERNDWLIELVWTIRISYLATPEIGQVQPPFIVNKITGGILRSKLQDFDDNRLDFTYRVNRGS